MSCTGYEMLCRVVPFAGLRLRLCRRHIERCPRCRQAEAEAWALPPILVTPGHLPAGLDLWPGVRGGIISRRLPGTGSDVVPLSPNRTWRLAFTAAAALLLLVVGTWIAVRQKQAGREAGPAVEHRPEQTRLFSAKIGDRPARVFQIQSRNPDRSIFWIAKDNTRS